MSDLANAFSRRERSHEIEKRKKQIERKRKWEEIKKLTPSIAEHIQIVTESFGKPRYLSVECHGTSLINTWPHGDDRRDFGVLVNIGEPADFNL